MLGQGDRLGVGGVEAARVRPLQRDDAGIRPERLGELSATHIESIDAAGTACQQAVGEAARRGTHVEAHAAGRVHAERVERAGQLLPAPRDIGRPRHKLQREGRVHQVAGLAVRARGIPHAADATGEQERLRLRSRGREAALGDELVEADAAQADVTSRGVAATDASASRNCAARPSTSRRTRWRRSDTEP